MEEDHKNKVAKMISSPTKGGIEMAEDNKKISSNTDHRKEGGDLATNEGGTSKKRKRTRY
jgi:hypothetical protein